MIQGTRQHVDLTAGIIDIVFLGHVIAHHREQTGQNIPKHPPPHVPHMHGAGGVGRDIFHNHRHPLTQILGAVMGAGLINTPQFLLPKLCCHPQVNKPGPRHIGLGDIGQIV